MASNDLDEDAEPFSSGTGAAVLLRPATSAAAFRVSETSPQDPTQSTNIGPGPQPGDHIQAPGLSPTKGSGSERQKGDITFPAVQPPCTQSFLASSQASPVSQSQDEDLQRDIMKGVHPAALKKFCQNPSSQSPSPHSEPSSHDVSDEDIEKSRSMFPDDLKLDYYDAMILYHEEDREAVEHFVKRVETDVKLNKVHTPRIVLFNDESIAAYGMMETIQLDKILPYCTYVLLYVTKSFCSDEGWSKFSSQTCLMEAIYIPSRRWTVVPIFTESKRKNTFNAPPSIRSLKGIQYLSADRFHVDSMRKLLEDKVIVRLEKEKVLKSERKKFIIRKREQEKREDEARRQEEIETANQERLLTEHFRQTRQTESADQLRLLTEHISQTRQIQHPIRIETPQEAIRRLSLKENPEWQQRQDSQDYFQILKWYHAQCEKSTSLLHSMSFPGNMKDLASSSPVHSGSNPVDTYSPASSEKLLSELNIGGFPSLASEPDQAGSHFTLGTKGSQSDPRLSEAVSIQQQQQQQQQQRPPFRTAGPLLSESHPYPGGDRYFIGSTPAQPGAGFPHHCENLEARQGTSNLSGLPGHHYDNLTSSFGYAGGHQSMPGPVHNRGQGDRMFTSMPPLVATAQSPRSATGFSTANQSNLPVAARASEQSQSISGSFISKEPEARQEASRLSVLPGENQESLSAPFRNFEGHQSMLASANNRQRDTVVSSTLNIARASEQSPSTSASSTTEEPNNVADNLEERRQGDGNSLAPQQSGEQLPEYVTADLPPESQVYEGQGPLDSSPSHLTKIRHVISEEVMQPPLTAHGHGHTGSKSRGEISGIQGIHGNTVRPAVSVPQNHQHYPQRYSYAPQFGQRKPEDYVQAGYSPSSQLPHQLYSPYPLYLPQQLHQLYDPRCQNFSGERLYNPAPLYAQQGNNPYYAGYVGQEHNPHWLPSPPPPYQQLPEPDYPKRLPQHQAPTVVYHIYNQGEKVPTTTINNINIKSADHVNVANKVAVTATKGQAGVFSDDNQHDPPAAQPAPSSDMMHEIERQSAEQMAAGSAVPFDSQHSSQNPASRLTDTVTADLRSQQSSECHTPEAQPSEMGLRDLPTYQEPPHSLERNLSSFQGMAQGGQQLDRWCQEYERDQETELKRFVTGPPEHESYESDDDDTKLKFQVMTSSRPEKSLGISWKALLNRCKVCSSNLET